MIVTLDIFSGRPNPSWTLSEKEVRHLKDRVSGRALPAPTAVDGILGFRGFIVRVPSDAMAQKAALPNSFRIGGPLAGELTPPEGGLAFSAIRTEEADDAARWLLSTARGKVEDALLSYVESVLNHPSASKELDSAAAETTEDFQDEGAAAEATLAGDCIIANTPYNPGFWNVPYVQEHNNCYNYAMDYRTDTLAQPGKISGHLNTVMQCTNVATAANWDGCTVLCSGSNKNVALVVWPNWDYHWYRKHPEGFWGHKLGTNPVRNTDNMGRLIGGSLTPANCDRGLYTQFCGYRFSPTGMEVE